MTAYYNELDPYAAQWLRNLIAAGHIADGVVDERSIEDVRPSDLKGFTQCHFFAGIGVWSYALRNAGLSDDRPVWTGSCPCQPFSEAGAGAGFTDERHLWPHFHWLIEQCAPAVVLGEQVASKDAEPWLDLVQADMEAMGYAFGVVAFPAASVGAPHIRDRLYWVADSELQQRQNRQSAVSAKHEARGREQGAAAAAGLRGDCGMADTKQYCGGCKAAPSNHIRSQTDRPSDQHGGHCGASSTRSGPTNGFWRDADWLLCRDGRWRPVEPGTFPLVNGAPARVGRLRTYGNAINAQAAQVFIESYLETE